MIQMLPDKIEFDEVCKDMEGGRELNLRDIANVFGWPFMELLIIMLTNEKGDPEIVNLLYDMRELLREKK